ncbi:MAG: hypothetical protein FWG66_03180, partial [Spirochaetes bacterium]|nr:hypothetical protein [Spirochaetota bacterium]
MKKTAFFGKKIATSQKKPKFHLTIFVKTGSLTLKAGFSALWTAKPAILGKTAPGLEGLGIKLKTQIKERKKVLQRKETGNPLNSTVVYTP